MDNLFAYLGHLGSRDALLNRHKILDDFVEGAERITLSDSNQELADRRNNGAPVVKTDRPDCLQLAEDTINLLKKRYTCTLSLPCGPKADKRTTAFVALEEFTRDLFLAHHNDKEKNDLLNQIGLSVDGLLGRHEIGQLRDRLLKILRDPVSDYRPEQRTAPARLREIINENMTTLFEAKPKLAAEVEPFIDTYYSDRHVHRELAALSRVFSMSLGAPVATLPDFRKRLLALLDNFARTTEETETGRTLLSSFLTAFETGARTFPSGTMVAACKDQRFLSQLQEDFNTAIQEEFEDDLKFLMIASYEYTCSLYRLKIRNGRTTEQAEYIRAFAREKGNIKKLLEYSSRKYLESGQDQFINSFNLGSAVLSNQQSSKVVLPHFLRRIYDTGVSEGKMSEREAIAHSLHDIGPILGLISVSTTRKNPYLQPLGDMGTECAASVSSFLNAFTAVPLDAPSARRVLAQCKQEAAKEKLPKRKQKALTFLTAVTSEKLAVLGQYLTERLTHACFLSKAYQLRNSTPYRRYIKQAEEDLHKKSLQALQNNLQDSYDFYLDPVIERLMLLPLPRTRLRILSFLEGYIQENVTGSLPDAPRGQTPAAALRYLEVLTGALSELITFWTELLIPCHILYYHYLVSECLNIDKTVSLDTQAYFAAIYDRYHFFANNNGQIDLAPALCETLKLVPLRDLQDENSFDLFAAPFYKFFLEETYRLTLSRNFYQLYVQSRQKSSRWYHDN